MRFSWTVKARPSSRISIPLYPLVISLFLFCACAAQPENHAGAPDPSTAPINADNQSSDNSLAKLCAQRASASSPQDFTVGPGDLIQINVPGMDEFRNYQARVSPTGTLELPLVGSVHAAGLTEQGLTDQLKSRLGEYVRTPDVEVLITQYESREVGVAGMVQKPGVYTLTSPSESMLDVISEAGGLAPTAASEVYFIPGKSGQLPVTAKTLVNAGSTAGAVASGQDVAVIDLSSPESSKYMSCPARPGDVLIAPAAGSVMVQGWVRQPGSFPITPKMTVLGAVDAAGGAMFSSSAHLLRGHPGGGKTDTPLDLSEIASGKQPDIPVESGDVVAVSSSAVGAVPYALYTILSRLQPGVGAFSGF